MWFLVIQTTMMCWVCRASKFCVRGWKLSTRLWGDVAEAACKGAHFSQKYIEGTYYKHPLQTKREKRAENQTRCLAMTLCHPPKSPRPVNRLRTPPNPPPSYLDEIPAHHRHPKGLRLLGRQPGNRRGDRRLGGFLGAHPGQGTRILVLASSSPMSCFWNRIGANPRGTGGEVV